VQFFLDEMSPQTVTLYCELMLQQRIEIIEEDVMEFDVGLLDFHSGGISCG